MPSFSVQKEGYRYYYETYASDQSGVKLTNFITATAVFVFSNLIITSSQFIPHYIHIQYPSWFIQSKFYWFDDILIAVSHCVCSLFIVIILINCHSPYDILHRIISETKISHNLIMKLTLYLLILVTISSIPIYFKYNWNHIHLISPNSNLCTLVRCDDIILFDTWFYFIHRAILPLIIYIIYLCYQFCSKLFDKHNPSSNPNLEMALLNAPKPDSVQFEYDVKQKSSPNTTIICLTYLILYSITVFFVHFQYTVNTDLLSNRFELIYIIFNIWSKLLKFAMKRTGSICDQLRSIKSLNDQYICLEYLTDWIFDVIYWNFVRYYIVFKAPSPTQYLFVLILHFSMEMVQTNMRYTVIFIKCRNYLANKRYCWSFILSASNDTEIWRNRLSMDIIMKLYASLLCTIMTVLQFIALGKDWFENQFGSSDYYRALIYTLISGTIESAHYVVSYYFTKRFYQFDIIDPFLTYVTGVTNKHGLALLMLYGTVFVMFLQWTRLHES